jgi:chemotaxis protein MotB
MIPPSESSEEALEAEARGLASELEAAQEEIAALQETQEDLVGKFAAEIAAGRIEVILMRDGLNLKLAAAVLFTKGSAELKESGHATLGVVAEELLEVPYQIVVAGYTDNLAISGELAQRYPTNWELAGARAARVVRLFEEAGIPGLQLLAVSHGDNRPVASNETSEGRSKNRRIEIRLRPVIPAK